MNDQYGTRSAQSKKFFASYTQSLEFFTALQRQGVPSRLVLFPMKATGSTSRRKASSGIGNSSAASIDISLATTAPIGAGNEP